jgi:hypothetical protein
MVVPSGTTRPGRSSIIFVPAPQTGRAQHQFAVLDAPQPDDLIGILAELRRLTLQHLNLETQPPVEVHVQRGKDASVVGVARLDQVLREIALFVVKKQRQARYRLPVLMLDPVLDEASPDQVANRLGSVAEPLAFEELVEVLEQIILNSDAYS